MYNKYNHRSHHTKDIYWWKIILPWSINFKVHHIMNWVNYLQKFFFASIQQKNCKYLDAFWDFSKNISSSCLAQIMCHNFFYESSCEVSPIIHFSSVLTLFLGLFLKAYSRPGIRKRKRWKKKQWCCAQNL